VATTDRDKSAAERLHTKVANWRCRPTSDIHKTGNLAAKPTFVGPTTSGVVSVESACVLCAGPILVNVNLRYTQRDLEHQLKDSGAKAIVISENFALPRRCTET
jgi:hypothetical protein